jgi:hypothetical protein
MSLAPFTELDHHDLEKKLATYTSPGADWPDNWARSLMPAIPQTQASSFAISKAVERRGEDIFITLSL